MSGFRLPGDELSLPGDTLRKVASDKTEMTYRTTEGTFTAPKLPPGLPLDKQTLDMEQALTRVQSQWGLQGMALSSSLCLLEEVAREIMKRGENEQPTPPAKMAALFDRLARGAVRPLSHAFRMTAAQFNEAQFKRRDRVTKAIRDNTLATAVRETPLRPTGCFSPKI